MALQALAEYAILSYAGGINLTVSLASTNLDYQETFALHRANQKLLQTAAVRSWSRGLWVSAGEVAGPHGVFPLQIPSLPTGLFVSAKGDGCCLMQVRSGTGLWGSKLSLRSGVDSRDSGEGPAPLQPPGQGKWPRAPQMEGLWRSLRSSICPHTSRADHGDRSGTGALPGRSAGNPRPRPWTLAPHPSRSGI